MKAFSLATRQPISNELFRKYLAYHVKTVSTEFVYSQIGTDYALVKMKVPVNNRTIDVKSFLFICGNGLNQEIVYPEKTLPLFTQFVETCLPARPDGEQPWQTISRSDKWKDRAMFLALAFKEDPEFYDVQSNLFPKLDPKKLLKQVQNMDNRELSTEISKLIKMVNVDEELISEMYYTATAEGGGETTSKKQVTKAFGPVLVQQGPAGGGGFDLNLLEPFRKRSGLIATFDSTKLVKQFLLSSIGVETVQDVSILAKTQKATLAPVLPEERKQLAAPLLDACEFNRPLTAGSGGGPTVLTKLFKITARKEWTPQLLIKSCIFPEEHLSSLEVERLKRIDGDNMSGVSDLILNISSVLVK